jgi:hypothetical protein
MPRQVASHHVSPLVCQRFLLFVDLALSAHLQPFKQTNRETLAPSFPSAIPEKNQISSDFLFVRFLAAIFQKCANTKATPLDSAAAKLPIFRSPSPPATKAPKTSARLAAVGNEIVIRSSKFLFGSTRLQFLT